MTVRQQQGPIWRPAPWWHPSLQTVCWSWLLWWPRRTDIDRVRGTALDCRWSSGPRPTQRVRGPCIEPSFWAAALCSLVSGPAVPKCVWCRARGAAWSRTRDVVTKDHQRAVANVTCPRWWLGPVRRGPQPRG